MKKVNKISCRTLLFMIGFAMVLLPACSDRSEDAAEKQLYTCGMDPQVIQEGPGNCPICGMKLTPLKAAAAEKDSTSDSDSSSTGERKIAYWRAPMDPTYVSDKPGKSPMGMDLIPVYEGEEAQTGPSIKIDPAVVQNMGVRTTVAERRPFSRTFRTVGHIDYNEEEIYSVNLKFAGWVENLYVNKTGEQIRKGQRLFEIYSPQLVSTQEEYRLAYDNAQKLEKSTFADISQGAEKLLRATEQRLKLWDISPEQIEKIRKTGELKKTLTINSPADGIVIEKKVVDGAHVKSGEELFRIADLSQVWVLAHIFEYEVPWIEVGQTVEMELPYIPGKKYYGKIEYIYPYLDSKARDIKIRLVFSNPDLDLKPQMYANITIKSSMREDVLTLPSEAILRTGTRNLVFVAVGEGKFEPRTVILGPEGADGYVLIQQGISEGEKIVTSAQFLLDSESRLRAAIQKMLDENKL